MSSGGSGTHKWHALHLVAKSIAAAIRLLPRRWRFRAAFLLARAAQPFFRRTEAYRNHENLKIDTAAEIALYLVINALTMNGTIFDPVVDIDGYDEFARICNKGRGVLLVQPHAMLTPLQFRIFHDRGLKAIGVSADKLMRIAGTTIPANPLVPSPTFLVTARNRLREGRLVSAMLDRGEHSAGRTVEFATANGPVIIAPALLQVAVRCGARVAFTEVHVDGWRVVGSIVVSSSDTVEGLTREFAAFVSEHIAARGGDTSAPVAMPATMETAQR